ncbi:MAG: hypothetical protein H6502_04375 [Candidatus Woesearchaeota archaeon]|nr:MAG: hypothetical protein H6502_04375 [Candidatus Woesearchaeota archaeon]
MNTMRPADLAWTLRRDGIDVTIIQLLKIMKTHGMKHELTASDVTHLRGDLSAKYGLDDAERRELADYLESDQAKEILGRHSNLFPLIEDDETKEGFLSYVATILYDNLEGSLRDKLNPHLMAVTVQNLGLVQIPRGRGGSVDDAVHAIPPELATRDPHLVERLFTNYFLKIIETSNATTPEAYEQLRTTLRAEYKRLVGGKDHE